MNPTQTKKVVAIYLGGFLTGVTLILFPGAGSILTDAAHHGFSSQQFGSIFTPQVIFAIIASLGATQLSNKIGMKNVLLFGIGALFISSILLAFSSQIEQQKQLAYITIMAATGFLGTGFGLSLTALNPFAYQLFKGKEDSSVTALHFFLGLGTAFAPLLVSFFIGKNMWYFAPIVNCVMLVVLFLLVMQSPFKLMENQQTEMKIEKGIPKRLYFYFLAAFFYGACEATFGNWGSVFLENQGLSVAKAALGLSLFWGFTAVGRLLFVFISLRFNTKWLYIISPLLVAGILLFLPKFNSEILYFVAIALSGLSLSFLFPKTVSSATDDFPMRAALVSGVMVACLQLGTGMSSNIIGFFNKSIPLSQLFQFSAVYALIFGGLVFYLTRKKV